MKMPYIHLIKAEDYDNLWRKLTEAGISHDAYGPGQRYVRDYPRGLICRLHTHGQSVGLYDSGADGSFGPCINGHVPTNSPRHFVEHLKRAKAIRP